MWRCNFENIKYEIVVRSIIEVVLCNLPKNLSYKFAHHLKWCMLTILFKFWHMSSTITMVKLNIFNCLAAITRRENPSFNHILSILLSLFAHFVFHWKVSVKNPNKSPHNHWRILVLLLKTSVKFSNWRTWNLSSSRKK